MRKGNTGLILAIVLLVLSLSVWTYQLGQGLIITNLRNSFSWGLYIATFAFFVGIAAGGLIVSSSVYLFDLKSLKPFTRIASLSAFASIIGAGVIILPDIGRVDRLYQMLLSPNFRSPLVWDVIVITFYLVITFSSVYFQLLPDWKRERRGILAGWTDRISQERLEEISSRWARRLALIGLPAAILIHTITALIFAVQTSRGWWHTATLPPDFVAIAVASGTALVLVIGILVAGRDNFTRYQEAFGVLARITAGALAVHFFFMYIDLLLHWWWGRPEEIGLLSFIFGRYGWLHWLEVGLPGFTMVYFFTRAGRRSPASLIGGSALLFIGVFAHRLMLMYPAFNQIPLTLPVPGTGELGWSYPIAVGQFQPGMPVFVNYWSYVPTLWEISVALLPFGLALFIISWMVKEYDFLPEKGSPSLAPAARQELHQGF